MQIDPKKVLSENMPDWEPVRDDRDQMRPSRSSADRIAGDDAFVRARYFGTAPSAAFAPDNLGLIASEEVHSNFVRATKKGGQDSGLGAKTFIVTRNKIVGSQG